MKCSLPGSSVHGILQARILEWIAIPFSRGSSFPTQALNLDFLHCRRFFTICANREARGHSRKSLNRTTTLQEDSREEESGQERRRHGDKRAIHIGYAKQEFLDLRWGWRQWDQTEEAVARYTMPPEPPCGGQDETVMDLGNAWRGKVKWRWGDEEVRDARNIKERRGCWDKYGNIYPFVGRHLAIQNSSANPGNFNYTKL